MNLTFNKDITYEVLLLLDDMDLENLCYLSSDIHDICNNQQLWYMKILNTYADLPVMNVDYKILYYKLKYDQWTDLVVYAENNDLLMHWISSQPKYQKFVISKIGQYQNAMATVTGSINKRKNLHQLLIFLYNHKRWLNSYLKYKAMVLHKLQGFINEEDKSSDLYQLYIKLFLD